MRLSDFFTRMSNCLTRTDRTRSVPDARGRLLPSERTECGGRESDRKSCNASSMRKAACETGKDAARRNCAGPLCLGWPGFYFANRSSTVFQSIQVPEVFQELGPPVPVVDVVGMFPHVDGQQRRQSVAQRIARIGHRPDRQLPVPVFDKPCPARAEQRGGGRRELLFESVERTEISVDRLGQRTAGLDFGVGDSVKKKNV